MWKDYAVESKCLQSYKYNFWNKEVVMENKFYLVNGVCVCAYIHTHMYINYDMVSWFSLKKAFFF